MLANCKLLRQVGRGSMFFNERQRELYRHRWLAGCMWLVVVKRVFVWRSHYMSLFVGIFVLNFSWKLPFVVCLMSHLQMRLCCFPFYKVLNIIVKPWLTKLLLWVKFAVSECVSYELHNILLMSYSLVTTLKRLWWDMKLPTCFCEHFWQLQVNTLSW